MILVINLTAATAIYLAAFSAEMGPPLLWPSTIRLQGHMVENLISKAFSQIILKQNYIRF